MELTRSQEDRIQRVIYRRRHVAIELLHGAKMDNNHEETLSRCECAVKIISGEFEPSRLDRFYSDSEWELNRYRSE